MHKKLSNILNFTSLNEIKSRQDIFDRWPVLVAVLKNDLRFRKAYSDTLANLYGAAMQEHTSFLLL